jgi:adenylate kinase
MRGRAGKEGRTDDANPDVVRHRIQTYNEQTAPCLAFYDDHSAAVHRINGTGSVDEVQQRIVSALGN